ncbi:MAG: (d)CMP kinase [Clostridia bacterium]
MKRISVAIDGPSGAGKSTIAKALARELGYLYVDTGAIYRTVGLYVKQNGFAPDDTARVAASISDIDIEIKYIDGVQHMFLNGTDVSTDIRRHEISDYASKVSAIPAVRDFLLNTQREYARNNDVIMDGRDIGTVVLPSATVKIFLTASPEDRARRRHLELSEKGEQHEFSTILSDIQSRDKNDSTRVTAPLRPAADAITVDTTGNTLMQSIEALKNIILERI